MTFICTGRDLGFPWWGYYLFRRGADEGGLVCLATELRDLGWPKPATALLSLGVGTLAAIGRCA